MKKKVIIFLAIILAIILSSAVLFKISKLRTFQFFGGLTNRVETNQKVVALTFDDAPSPYSIEVLKILKEKNIKATFYMIGGAIEQFPNEAKAIIDVGMEVGNHSYSHERFLLKSQSFIDSEIQKTNKLIRDLDYKKEITFRPPNGKKLFGLPWYLKQKNIKTIMWDVEPDTYVNGAQNLVNYTLENTKAGSIILIHPFCESDCADDREALPKIIDGLKEKGYQFLTVSELLMFK